MAVHPPRTGPGAPRPDGCRTGLVFSRLLMRGLPLELWVLVLTAVLVVASLVTAVVVAIVISQRKLARASRAFAAREVAATEEERSRVARELHDGVSQEIAVLSQRLEAVRDSVERGLPAPDLLTTVDLVGDGLRRIAASVRGIAHRMHPSAIDQLGLRAALEGLAREMEAGTGFRVSTDIAPAADTLPTEVALTLYRIAQEGFRNIQKHARAGTVMFRLSLEGGRGVLQLQDDGAGFASTSAPPGGLGLVSIRERARLLEGFATIQSEPGGGTLVEVTFPVPGRT